jgi:integrase
MATKKIQKLNKYGLPFGSGQIVHIKDGRALCFQARKTKWDNIERKNKVVWERSYRTECEASRALLEVNGKPAETLKKENITFGELYAEWAERPSGMGALKENSQKQFKSVYNAHCGGLVKMRFGAVTADELQTVIDYCRAGYQTKNQIKSLLSHLYKLALSKEIVLTDKSANLYIGSDDGKKETAHFTDAEARAVIELADAVKYGWTAKLMLYSGMRMSEVLGLKPENVNLGTGVFEAKFGVKTQSGISRKLPIHSEIFGFVKARAESGAKYIIENEKGEKVSARAYADAFSDQLKRANVGAAHLGAKGTSAVTHKCRHTFLTKLYELGTEKLVIKRIAGHANSDVTDLYTHVGLEKLRAAVESVKY